MPILEVPQRPVCQFAALPTGLLALTLFHPMTASELGHFRRPITSVIWSAHFHILNKLIMKKLFHIKQNKANKQTNSRQTRRQTKKHSSAKYRDEGQSESLVLSAVNNYFTPRTILEHAAQRVYKLPVACFSHDFPTVVVLTQCE